ncbi:MAG: hypothetical protein AAGA85_13225 [Bacteroidota bacterium]
MKQIFSLFFLSLLFVGCDSDSETGIEIQGYAKNAGQEYIRLAYAPRLRGNLNFDNFKPVHSFIDAEGRFEFSSQHLTDAANYTLEFRDNAILLVLFKGDNIHLDFDIEKPRPSLFATGKGAGKVNTLNLSQFGYDNFDLESQHTLSEFGDHSSRVIAQQEALLEAIYLREANAEVILDAQNKSKIQRIIDETPLSEREYRFLSNRIHFQRHSLLTSFISQKAGDERFDTLAIDFDHDAFQYLHPDTYQKLTNINDWHLANDLHSMVQMGYVRDVSRRSEAKVTYGNWRSFLYDTDYFDWIATYMQTNFNEEINNKYYADLAAWTMTLGNDYESAYHRISVENRSNKYLRRLDEFKTLLEEGLDNAEYGLNDNDLELDEHSFNALLESYENEPLLIVFWSAKFAGASIIDLVPAIKSFEASSQEEVNLITICIDEQVNKKVWAARVIDNDWKSNHFFLPVEGQDSILHQFTDRDISTFCNGGASYAFIDRDGQIHQGIQFPFYQSVEEIEKRAKKATVSQIMGTRPEDQ